LGKRQKNYPIRLGNKPSGINGKKYFKRLMKNGILNFEIFGIILKKNKQLTAQFLDFCHKIMQVALISEHSGFPAPYNGLARDCSIGIALEFS
jgi:hypothetical protein